MRPERLVCDHLSCPKSRATVTFDEQRPRTKLTMRMIFGTAAERDRMVEVFGTVEGARTTLGRLANFLAKA